MTEILPRAYDLDKMSSKNVKEVFSGAFRFLSGNFFSKVTGLGRDISLAAFFGSSPFIAAFMVAFRFCHFFRRFFGEGAIGTTFIPHFEKLVKEDEHRAFRFYIDFLLIATLSFTAFVFLLRFLIFHNLQAFPEGWRDIASYSARLLPTLIFITIFAVNQAYLQTQNVFFLPALTPIFVNICWIVGAFLSSKGEVDTLIFWILLGYVLQALFTFIPIGISKGRHFFQRPFSQKFFVFNVARSSLVLLIGIGALQINSFIDGLFANVADPSGPAYLWYSVRIYQFPFSIVSISLASALLPKLSRSDNFVEYLKPTTDKLMILIIPCTFAMIVLGVSGIELLFGRGAFSEFAAYNTAKCLYAYAISLLPASLIYIYSHAFYAKRKFYLPSLLTLFSVCLNVALNSLFLFVFHFSTLSIALATSFTSIVQLMALLMVFQSICSWKELISLEKFFKIGFASLLGMLCTLTVGYQLGDPTISLWMGEGAIWSRGFSVQLYRFILESMVFIVTFALSAYFLRQEEITLFMRGIFYPKSNQENR